MFVNRNRPTACFKGAGILPDTAQSGLRSGKRTFLNLARVSLLLCLAWGYPAAAMAQATEQILFSGLTEPTVVQFASDGRVFVAEKSGLIKVFDDLADTSETVFADLRLNVYTGGDDGLTAMVLDPAFPSKPYVYVLYTYNGGSSSPCPQLPCLLTSRLSRLQASGNVMTGAEQVLVADWRQHYPGQPAGGLAFGPDGALYVSGGDGANSEAVDFGQADGPNLDPPNEGGALRSQDLRTPADAVTLSGSLARVHPDTGAPLTQTTSLIAGTPTVDANGVKSYTVTSGYLGNVPVVVRVLAPTSPAPGKLHRILYVLPVTWGVTSLSSEFSDGLEELRLLNAHNRYNLTLIAPSFPIEPWYGDHSSDPSRQLESYIVRDLIPFGYSLTPGQTPQVWVLGFSKSGNGTLTLLLRNPNVFTAGAAWDAPAQFTEISHTAGMIQNFGTEENFDRYEIPALVVKNAEAFRTRNRMWISGDDSAWTSHMIQLDQQTTDAGVLHTFIRGGWRAHSWNSGWLEGALASLDQNATSQSSLDPNAQRIISYGLREPSRFVFRPGTHEIWVADKGWNNWQEINRVGMATDGAVENFGWPCYEGTSTTSYSGLSLCQQLYSQTGAATAPFYQYPHSQQVVAGESCPAGTGEISGLAFYGSGPYAGNMQGALFFADRSRNCVWAMLKGSNGLPDPATRVTVVPGAASPVDLKIGPEGYLFYVDFSGGTVRRVTSLADGGSLSFSINDVTLAEGNSGARTATFTVTKSGTTQVTATVQAATAVGTATADGDYVAVSPTTLTFLPGDTTKTFAVTINGDTTFETSETFLVNLSNPTNATIGDNQGIGTITNDDAAPTFAINNVTVTEGNSDTTTASFTVTKTGATDVTATVRAATANGTATAGDDYNAVGLTTLTFAPAETTQTVSVTINGDSTFEADETFFVNLSNPGNATINDGQGIGTITNDDELPPDTTAPVRSNGLPDGSLQPGTTQTTMSLQTNENAVCRYATSSGRAFSAMTNSFTTTGGLTHSTTITGLQNGTNYSFYVRCQDSAGNVNTNDYVIDFKVGGKKKR